MLARLRLTRSSNWNWISTPTISRSQAAQATGRGFQQIITEIAWKAQNRLHKRYMKLMAAGKDQGKTMTAIERELLGFIWAIGIRAETECKQQLAA